MGRRLGGALAAPSPAILQWRYRTAVEAARMLNATARDREPRQVLPAAEGVQRTLPTTEQP